MPRYIRFYVYNSNTGLWKTDIDLYVHSGNWKKNVYFSRVGCEKEYHENRNF